jgi:hypothetical protein
MEELKTVNKFRVFNVYCEGGDIITVKAPQNKVTTATALKYAYHWVKMQHQKKVSVIAVQGVK